MPQTKERHKDYMRKKREEKDSFKKFLIDVYREPSENPSKALEWFNGLEDGVKACVLEFYEKRYKKWNQNSIITLLNLN